MSLITDLYQGDIYPAEDIGSRPGPCQTARGMLYKSCDLFSVCLHPDQQVAFDQIMDLVLEVINTGDEEAFTTGYKLAVKSIIESLQ